MRRERSPSPPPSPTRSRSAVVKKIVLLQAELAEAEAELASFVPQMPRDALLLIFRELSFEQRWRLRRVCKLWKGLIENGIRRLSPSDINDRFGDSAMEGLKGCTNLVSLNFGHFPAVTYHSLPVVSHLTSLCSLHLGAQVYQSSVPLSTVLAPLQQLTQLTSMNISEEQVVALKACTQLRSLRLLGCKSGRLQSALDDLVTLTNITDLELRAYIPWKTVKRLLSSLPRLQTLALRGHVPEINLTVLNAVVKLPLVGLKLAVRDRKVSEQTFLKLSGMTQLRHLAVESSHLVDLSGLEQLSLESLILLGSPNPSELLTALRPMAGTLHTLLTTGIGLTDDLNHLTRLTTLESNCQVPGVTGRGFNHGVAVLDAPCMSNLVFLRHLTLSRVSFARGTIRALSHLPLEEVMFVGCTGEGLTEIDALDNMRVFSLSPLEQALPFGNMPKLNSLSFMGVSVVETLRPVATMTWLRELALPSCRVLDVATVSSWTALHSLSKLALANSNLDSKMACHLAQLPNLQDLSLMGCDVNEMALYEIRHGRNRIKTLRTQARNFRFDAVFEKSALYDYICQANDTQFTV